MHAVQLLVDDGWGRRRSLGEWWEVLLGFCFLVKGKVAWLCTCRRHGFCGCVDEMGMGVVGGCGW